MTSWEVHDVEMSAYEQHIGHPITGDAVPPAGTVGNYVHPDNCPDCAANPRLGAAIHAAELGIAEGIEAIMLFFEDGFPRVIAMKIGMSFYLSLSARQQEIMETLSKSD